MRILLLGEYSNVHATLAVGLRRLGHEVVVASNGDFWKDYPRDTDLSRSPGRFGGMRLLAKVLTCLPSWRGFDVVQLINPMFLELRAERISSIYHYLRRHNGSMFLGAFGMDYYWVHENITRKPLRYSDFNFGNRLRDDRDALIQRSDWLGTTKERLNKAIAQDCDGIIAGLYEYWACYQPLFPHKTTFIPFPICPRPAPAEPDRVHQPLRIFIGISRNRSAYKGTDVMLAAAKALKKAYPSRMDLRVVEGLPFEEYVRLMNESDVILDQLYSYTPAMNALEAMNRSIVVVGGGEPENYDILHEQQLRPIVNVLPTYESVYQQLEQLVLHPEHVADLKRQGRAYIAKHHDYMKVARQYEAFYLQHMKKK